MDDYEEKWRAYERAENAKAEECRRRARRAVQLLLEGQPPPEGEDYGFWKPHLTRLLQAFEKAQARGVQGELMRLLQEPEKKVRMLLRGVVTSDGQYWVVVLEKVWQHMQAEERRMAAERRMRERLARSTGDSMADEILAMLREQALSRTDIYRRYSRNVSAERINDALFVLERLGWARCEMVSTGGRRREVWSVPADEEE